VRRRAVLPRSCCERHCAKTKSRSSQRLSSGRSRIVARLATSMRSFPSSGALSGRTGGQKPALERQKSETCLEDAGAGWPASLTGRCLGARLSESRTAASAPAHTASRCVRGDCSPLVRRARRACGFLLSGVCGRALSARARRCACAGGASREHGERGRLRRGLGLAGLGQGHQLGGIQTL